MIEPWPYFIDMIPLKTIPSGWFVDIHRVQGRLYGDNRSWSLMLQLIPPIQEQEGLALWASASSRALWVASELDISLCYSDEQWWLFRCYDVQSDVSDIQTRINEHVRIVRLLENKVHFPDIFSEEVS